MYGYVYLTTNLVNNKKYIGQHKSSIYDNSYIGSGTRLKEAINKYGIENFKNEVLVECDTWQDLTKWEEYYIALYNCTESDEYYNLSPYGQGNPEWFKKYGTGEYKGSIADKIWVNNGTNQKAIAPCELDNYIKLGWLKGGINKSNSMKAKLIKSKSDKICVNKNNKNKYINKEDLDKYLLDGYSLGGINRESTNLNKVWVHNETSSKMIYAYELDTYLQAGWLEKRGKLGPYKK